MKLELKSVTYSERQSEETACFAADLWVDGVKVAYVQNAGHGGCDDVRAYPNMDEKLKAVEAWAKSLPPIVCDDLKDPQDATKPFTYEQDLEGLVGNLLTDWLIAKDLKKLLKEAAFLFDNGSVKTLKCKGDDPRLPPYVAKIKADGGTFLNALPFDEALALYRKHVK